MLELNQIYNGDCLELMKDIPDKSIDMILCDLPYGTTACKWDNIIPFEPMWERCNKLIKSDGAICFFGSEPFSSRLRMSNMRDYKYDWIWNKKLAGNGILAKKQPLKIHEIISVFHSKIYYPQMQTGKLRKKMFNGKIQPDTLHSVTECKETFNDKYYPVSIQEFSAADLRVRRLHPTQKPVNLLEYLIRTYTVENETVLDFTAGSGSTAVACLNTKRNYILMEKDKGYFDISIRRIEEVRLHKETGQLKIMDA